MDGSVGSLLAALVLVDGLCHDVHKHNGFHPQLFSTRLVGMAASNLLGGKVVSEWQDVAHHSGIEMKVVVEWCPGSHQWELD